MKKKSNRRPLVAEWNALRWGGLSLRGGGNAMENSPPPTTNQRWRISWWFQGCICSFLRKNEMLRYVCLDFWWNVGDGGKLVSTAWNKFSPCCSHLMIETYCCSYKLSQQTFRKEFLLVSSYLKGFGGWSIAILRYLENIQVCWTFAQFPLKFIF